MLSRVCFPKVRETEFFDRLRRCFLAVSPMSGSATCGSLHLGDRLRTVLSSSVGRAGLCCVLRRSDLPFERRAQLRSMLRRLRDPLRPLIADSRCTDLCAMLRRSIEPAQSISAIGQIRERPAGSSTVCNPALLGIIERAGVNARLIELQQRRHRFIRISDVLQDFDRRRDANRQKLANVFRLGCRFLQSGRPHMLSWSIEPNGRLPYVEPLTVTWIDERVNEKRRFHRRRIANYSCFVSIARNAALVFSRCFSRFHLPSGFTAGGGATGGGGALGLAAGGGAAAAGGSNSAFRLPYADRYWPARYSFACLLASCHVSCVPSRFAAARITSTMILPGSS